MPPSFIRFAVLLCFCLTITGLAQQKTTFEDLAALVLSNDKVELTVITEGGAMGQIVLAADKEKINPIWNPYWIARQAGLQRPASFFRGHFACLDGFGPVSNEERDAGMPFHGEAPTLPWQLRTYQKTGGYTECRVFCHATARTGNPDPDVSRRRRREHRVGGQLTDQPVGIRPPRLLGRACDDQRAFPRARQGRRRHVHIAVEDQGRCRGCEAAATTALVRGFHLADGADGRRPAVRPAHRAVESRARPST